MAVIQDGETRYKTFVDDPDAYAHIAEQLVWVVRGDMVKRVKENNIKKAPGGSQLEHVFEVQYFAIAFILTVRCYRDSIKEQRWFPAADDIHLAANIVNNVANVKPYPNTDHALKSGYFRMGSKAVLELHSPLIRYLNDAATDKDVGFAQLVNNYDTALWQQAASGGTPKPLNIKFQLGFLEILKATPWYRGGWENIIFHSGTSVQFASNATDWVKESYYREIAENFDQDVFAPNAF